MSDKLLEALKAVVSEIKSMHPIELTQALKEASKSEFAQTIDVLNHFTSSVRLVRSDDEDSLSLFIPIESNQLPDNLSDKSKAIQTIADKHNIDLVTIKTPCLFNQSLNFPIGNIVILSQPDTEDPSPILFVPKSSIETLIQDLNRLGHNLTELDVGEEDVLCYTIEGKSPDLQLNICENFIEIYIDYSSVYYKEYNSDSVDEIDKFLSRV